MSLKKFLSKVVDSIADFFNGLEPTAKKSIAIGVKVTDLIKDAFDKGYVDIATSLIPGTLDDAIAAKIREALPGIMIDLQLASKCMDETEPDKIVACAIETLKGLTGNTTQYDFFDSLAVQIGLVAADGKLDWNDLKSTVKWYNDHVKKTLPDPAGLGK